MPEDPALLRAAPADTQVFVQWFGVGVPTRPRGWVVRSWGPDGKPGTNDDMRSEPTW